MVNNEKHAVQKLSVAVQVSGGNTMAKGKHVTRPRVGVSGGAGDVTARKLAEEALLKAGALQCAIFNSANF